MDKKVIIIVVIIICVLLICSSISSGVGSYLYSGSTPEETKTPETIKPKVNTEKKVITKPNVTTLPKEPVLQSGTLQWQNRCPGDCGGLIWTTASNNPWNKYYKFSCENTQGESALTKSFGPVVSYNWNNPKLRVAADDGFVCGDDSKLKVYRSSDSINFDVIPDSYLMNFSGTGVYDRKGSIFIDTWSLKN